MTLLNEDPTLAVQAKVVPLRKSGCRSGRDMPITPTNPLSSLLLPSAARRLMKNVTGPSESDEWQIEEAGEHDDGPRNPADGGRCN
jgi:hypothetical protein